MEDFFKQFRENWENRPEPPFEEKDWRKLEERLAKPAERRRAGAAWAWFVVPLLFLSLGTNALLLVNLGKNNTKAAAPERLTDTVFITKVIYNADTIFQTKIVRETLVKYLPARFSEQTALGFTDFKTGSTPLTTSGSVSLTTLDTAVISKNETPAPDNATNTAEWPATDLQKIKTRRPRPILSAEHFESPQITVEPVVEKRRRTFRQRVYALQPKEFHLGVTGGWAYPFSEGLKRQSGFSLGLRAAVGFSPSLRMWADATWCKVSFETDRMDPAIGVPVVDPPSDEFKFVVADVPQPSLQFAAGMQYLFNADGKWKPYLGAGYGTVAMLPYEIVYDFRNEALGIEWSIEKQVVQEKTLSDFLLLTAGLERRFSKHWNGQIGLTYRTVLGENSFQAPRMIGLQGGILYGF